MALPEYEQIARFDRSKTSALSTNLPVVEEADASGRVAALYDHFKSHFGRPDVPGILKCFATHPPLLEHMMALSESLIFSEGFLTRRHKEMIATLVSSQNDCAYCADSHGFMLRMNGGSAETLCAIQENKLRSPSLSEVEQALLTFVEKINGNSQAIGPADILSIREAGWDDAQIAEAIHVAALFATFNRVVNAFGLPSQGLLPLYESQVANSSPESAGLHTAQKGE
jgi:uncharacterized peroxidase-related enzyme